MGQPLAHALTRNIGRQLPECEKLPIDAFGFSAANEMDINISELSTDQNYMLQAYRAISSGHCDDSLAHKNPGKMTHSRWLTTANRLLRLLMATERPSNIFVTIIKLIMTVYTAMWFKIKTNPSITKASQHLHGTIVRIGKLDSQNTTNSKTVIQRNANYILINMMHDEN